MRIPCLKIPEIEKIPAADRENFFRRCDETDEMRRFRSRSKFLLSTGLLCSVGIPILLSEFVFHWHPAIEIAIGAVLAFAALFVFSYLSMQWQLWIIRRLVIQELRGHNDA